MTVYTTSQARQRLTDVLDDAEREGAVRIRSEDGREFDITPVPRSPFDIESAPGLDLTADEIVAAIHQGRERT